MLYRTDAADNVREYFFFFCFSSFYILFHTESRRFRVLFGIIILYRMWGWRWPMPTVPYRRIIFHLYLGMTFDFHIDDAIFAGKVKRRADRGGEGEDGLLNDDLWMLTYWEHDGDGDPPSGQGISLYLPSGRSDPKYPYCCIHRGRNVQRQ